MAKTVSKESEKPVVGADAQDAETPIIARHRSPNYPFIDLDKAIKQTKCIHGPDRLRDIPLRVACQRWEFKLGGSQADQTVAALKAFGLVEVTSGIGENRILHVSERAYRIILNARDAESLIKEAALLPSLHNELWQKFGSSGVLPGDDVIRHYLLFDRESSRFNVESVDIFIERFRATISFAKLQSIDKILSLELPLDKEPEQESDEKDEQMNDSARTHEQQKQSQLPPLNTGMKEDVFTSETGNVVVRWPAVLASADDKDLDVWLERIKRRIKQSIQTDASDQQN